MAEDLRERVLRGCRLTASALDRKSEREALSLVVGLNRFRRDQVSRLVAEAARHGLPILRGAKRPGASHLLGLFLLVLLLHAGLQP